MGHKAGFGTTGGFLVALVVLGLLLGACGAGRIVPTATTATTAPLTVAQAYQRIVRQGNEQLQVLTSRLNSEHGDIPRIEADFAKVGSVYSQVADQVRALHFAPSVRPDVGVMIADLERLSTDGRLGAESVTLDDFNAVFTRLDADQKAEVAANTKVNHDLGIDSIG